MLQDIWPHLINLTWIHSASAGVEKLLFPELVKSQVAVTNAKVSIVACFCLFCALSLLVASLYSVRVLKLEPCKAASHPQLQGCLPSVVNLIASLPCATRFSCSKQHMRMSMSSCLGWHPRPVLFSCPTCPLMHKPEQTGYTQSTDLARTTLTTGIILRKHCSSHLCRK